jgi:selenide,water dikinase
MQEMFKPADYPNLLVGLDGPDDAAVWRLDESRALVITTDFFTPVVDEAYDYGAIAAANSLSDVYAMGGKPFLALNTAAMPDDLPTEIASEILRGGAEKAREAGVVIAGGHTVKDREPKYGLVVVGFVDPNRMLMKGGLREGDALVLTKPLGFGVTTTALKREQAESRDVSEVVGWMSRLNKSASELAVEFNLRGGTDVTGYSLPGHGLEMAEASGVALQIEYEKIPFVSCARKYAELGAFAGGAFDNREYYRPRVHFTRELDEPAEMSLFDPQTSGGLLLGVPQEKLSAFLRRAGETAQPVWVIGQARPGAGIEIV